MLTSSCVCDSVACGLLLRRLRQQQHVFGASSAHHSTGCRSHSASSIAEVPSKVCAAYSGDVCVLKVIFRHVLLSSTAMCVVELYVHGVVIKGSCRVALIERV